MKKLLLALLLAGTAHAQTHYYDPEHIGHGVSKTWDNGQGSAFIWYLYDRAGEPGWLISTENCHEYPCVVGLAEVTSEWMGGNAELVEVGNVYINFEAGKMVWDYNISDWDRAGDCGRLVWQYQNKCVGTFKMEPIDGLD